MPKGAPKPGAVVMIGDAEGRITELHSFTCNHCGNPVVVPEGRKVEECSDICRSCFKLHCLRAACCESCTPFIRTVEAMEARYQSLVSMGLAP